MYRILGSTVICMPADRKLLFVAHSVCVCVENYQINGGLNMCQLHIISIESNSQLAAINECECVRVRLIGLTNC